MAELQDNLPPGWDSKLDLVSGKYYFINHFTKMTTWEDPRIRHRPLHATPKHFTNMTVEHIPLQDMRGMVRSSPLAVRSCKIQDSSFGGNVDTEEAVAKIGAMFPTVPETHIKMLMKNCRYMKSLFPQAEETIILEVLQNNESNIQKSTEVLKDMGFQRKDTVKAAQQKLDAKIELERQEEIKRAEPPAPLPKIKTTQEKSAIKLKLREKYKDVAEHLITMALESVDFNEKRASQILDIMVQEDTEKNTQSTSDQVDEATPAMENELKPTSLPVSQSRQSIKSLIKAEKTDQIGFSRVIEELGTEYKSTNISNTKGPNANLAKGPSVALLDDYVDWQGPNKNAWKGSQCLAKGPNRSLIGNRSYQVCGSNAALRKGPKCGLAKGSIFSQLKSIVVGESRGK